MGSRGRESTAVRHESSAIRIVGGVSRSFGSVCDIVTPLIFTVTDRFRQKKKIQHGSGREWESFFREWNGTGFPPSFFVGLGREEIHFCGSGTGEV